MKSGDEFVLGKVDEIVTIGVVCGNVLDEDLPWQGDGGVRSGLHAICPREALRACLGIAVVKGLLQGPLTARRDTIDAPSSKEPTS